MVHASKLTSWYLHSEIVSFSLPTPNSQPIPGNEKACSSDFLALYEPWAMYIQFFSVNTANAIKIFDVERLKVKQAVPERRTINFFGQVKYSQKFSIFISTMFNPIKP